MCAMALAVCSHVSTEYRFMCGFLKSSLSPSPINRVWMENDQNTESNGNKQVSSMEQK